METEKIGLDIDGVLCDFIGGFYKHFGKEYIPREDWGDEFVYENWHLIEDDEDFWMNLEPLVDPKDIQFDIYCYITARPIPTCITFLWLQKHGFQYAPVFSTGLYSNKHCKIATVNRLKLDFFVDDKYENFLVINENTQTYCYLHTQSHNIKHEHPFKRVDSVLELNKFCWHNKLNK